MFIQQALGRSMIYTFDEGNRATNALRKDMSLYRDQDGTIHLENYDITSICKGHLNYRSSLDKIFEAIDFDF